MTVEWLLRLVVRRVVWIIVGLVVLGVLAAVGVRANTVTLTGTYDCDPNCPLVVASDAFAGPWQLGLLVSEGSTLTVHVVCPEAVTNSSSAYDGGEGAWVVSMSGYDCATDGPIEVYGTNGSDAELVSDGSYFNYQSEALPGDPPTVVALAAEDRDRLDLLIFSVVTLGGLLVFSGGGLLMATLLRGR